MTLLDAAGNAPVAIDLNNPGSYLNWNIFTISVANLVLIAVMVVIFGAALLLPFPKGHRGETAEAIAPEDATVAPDIGTAPGDERMWTARVRRRALTSLPPNKLLPDRQPAYVASWVYVFGVADAGRVRRGDRERLRHRPRRARLVALPTPSGTSSTACTCGASSCSWPSGHPPVGQVLDGRLAGRRALTWITGVVAFLAAVVECFTGYLSQQNFDSQWIATNGKDAFNAVGVGAFFNLMNFGQMLMWHIVLLPIVLIAHHRRARAAGPRPRRQPPAAGHAGLAA